MPVIQTNGLQVSSILYEFINSELLLGVGIDGAQFWHDFASLIADFTPRNQQLLKRRDLLQAQIDDWHRQHRVHDPAAYKQFLMEIGYLEPDVEDFTISTKAVDPEIATIAGPQLVVPINNARYALNAANARWRSLYDAVYGSDIIADDGELARGQRYNSKRGQRVVEYSHRFLDRCFALTNASHSEVGRYLVSGGQLQLELSNGLTSILLKSEQFVGYSGTAEQPDSVLLKNNGLHVELQFDRQHPVGKIHPAGVKDLIVESAITTIQDCEDSVSAVDAEDKVLVYRNWLGLMKGDLTVTLEKSGKPHRRSLNADREYLMPNAKPATLPGRSLMLIRHVGLLLTNPAIVDRQSNDIFEGLLDAVMTATAALYDLKGKDKYKNSNAGSIYCVKPKLHGSEEVEFCCDLFDRIETILNLKPNTIKLGLMDEERRTSLNLKQCIKKARHRLIFINTGFLDRTGDEIHTSIEAGVMDRKAEMKHTPWMQAYEQHNVELGLACGLSGKAQIGKGMWAAPDQMKAMMESKDEHPKAGANCAWVPSPTAATLHALHYHQIDVWQRQRELITRTPVVVDALLSLPVVNAIDWNQQQIQQELENNCQGLLGYVVRWINQGIGCSKVPDINNIGLMEDRATLRISSQHIANWLHHRVVTQQQVIDTLERMAKVVDLQNDGDHNYIKLESADHSLAFNAALELILSGHDSPNGYTDLILNRVRREQKIMRNKMA